MQSFDHNSIIMLDCYLSNLYRFTCKSNFSLKIVVQQADIWSCGVTLYVMLVGAYPFEDQRDPKNFRKTIGVSLQISLT